jgi:bifunctional non-homologous end joining protein LigD
MNKPSPDNETDITPLHFVLHEHFARHHHYDFRLEKDNVLKSWAVPKGLPETFKDRRLAVETEDHGLSFINFEGPIPDGEYGAGDVRIADAGTYRQVRWLPEKIEVVLYGQRFSGTYVLVRFRHAEPGQWLVIKKGV